MGFPWMDREGGSNHNSLLCESGYLGDDSSSWMLQWNILCLGDVLARLDLFRLPSTHEVQSLKVRSLGCEQTSIAVNFEPLHLFQYLSEQSDSSGVVLVLS